MGPAMGTLGTDIPQSKMPLPRVQRAVETCVKHDEYMRTMRFRRASTGQTHIIGVGNVVGVKSNHCTLRARS